MKRATIDANWVLRCPHCKAKDRLCRRIAFPVKTVEFDSEEPLRLCTHLALQLKDEDFEVLPGLFCAACGQQVEPPKGTELECDEDVAAYNTLPT